MKKRTQKIGIVIGMSLLTTPVIVFGETAEPLPKSLPKAIETKVRNAEELLLTLTDCDFLLQIFDPKDVSRSQLALCFYPLKLERGIFVQTTCVGVLVEPESLVRNPFYGSNGHWGVEGPCTKESLEKKLQEPEIDRTVNPITDLRGKQKDGFSVRMLRDKLGIWKAVKNRISPEIKTQGK